MRSDLEEPIHFDTPGGIHLEGLYAPSEGSTGAVIAHPHPLMGGDMMNPVVRAVAESLQKDGLATLRFNFRGVGRSSGRYDDGQGEEEDFIAAASFLRMRGKDDIVLIGYSFGAWICGGVLSRISPSAAVLIAPPLDLFNFDIALQDALDGLIVCGRHDPFCPSEKVRIMAARLSWDLVFIDTDHFFFGTEGEVARQVRGFLRSLFIKMS